MTDKSDNTQAATPEHAAVASDRKRAYQAPRIVSAEPLEAAAATCQPQTGVFGKSVPVPCGTVGS